MPPRIETDAIVLDRFPYGESSQVAHLLTESVGRVAVLAKGACREKNDFEGPLDVLARGRVVISLVQGRELGLLLKRRLTTNHPRLRLSLERFAGATHLLRQVEDFEPFGAGDAHAGAPDTFRLFERALQALETLPTARIPLLLLAFDLRLLRAHGLAPSLEACVRCGAPEALARFVPADGGAVCRGCLASSDEGERIDLATARLLAALGARPLADVAAPAEAVLSRARRIVDVHGEWHAGAAGPASRRRAGGARRRALRG